MELVLNSREENTVVVSQARIQSRLFEENIRATTSWRILMARPYRISNESWEVLQGQSDPARVEALRDDVPRLQLVRAQLRGSDASELISPDAAALAVSESGELGSAYAQLFDTLGVEPERLLAA